MIWNAKQGEHNRETQRYLSMNPRYPDWEITALFYSALHIVDEYLILKDKRPCRHGIRNRRVREELGPIYGDYHDLYTLCIRARYDVGFDQLTENEKEMAIQWHKSIHDYIQNKMS